MRFNIVLVLVILAVTVATSSAYTKRASSSKYKWNLKPHVQRGPIKRQRKVSPVNFNPAPIKARTFVPPDFTLPVTKRTTTKRPTTKKPTTKKPTTTTTTKKPRRSTTTRYRPTFIVDPTVTYPTSKLGLERGNP